MDFISHGDFGFPLNWLSYLKSLFFVLNDSGISSLDNNLRFFIRVPQLLVLFLTNNIYMSYFYILSIILLSFVGFYMFSTEVLNFKNRRVRILASLFFSINPVFLGNFSKIGLTLCVALLPFIILFAHRYYENYKISNLFWIIILLNFSLIHPFNFLINFISVWVYFLYRFVGSDKKRKILKSTLVSVGIGIMIFFYIFILLFSLESDLNKSEISSSIGAENGASGFLSFANTGTLFNSLIMYKPILKDYEYFSGSYYYYYLISTSIIALLAILPLFSKKSQKKKTVYLFWLLLLVLLALSSMKFVFLEKIFENIVNLLSFGWVFRSPLKWQLYVPFAYSVLLLFSLNSIFDKISIKKTASVLLMIVMIILPNAYLSSQIYEDLLIPDGFESIDGKTIEILRGESLLILKNKHHIDATPEDESFNSEVSVILRSYNIRFSYIEFDSGYLTNFDKYGDNYRYILSYSELSDSQSDELKIVKKFENGYSLYEQINPQPDISNASYYKKNNPIEYDLYFEKQSGESHIKLLLPFKPGWKLYLKKNPSKDWCHTLNFYNSTDTVECKSEQRIFSKEYLLFITEKEVFEESHERINDYVNGWIIDSEYIKENYPSEYYNENADGSIDFELILYFKPQSYFILGIFVSGITLLSCIGYIIYNREKEAKLV